MFDAKTRISFFAAPITAAVIALLCTCGQLFADGIAETNSDDTAFTVAWFDSLVFGRKSDAATFRVRLENLLEKKASAAQRICELSDRERRKLVLAGHGDIKRLFDRIERVRLEACGNKRFPPELVAGKLRAFSQVVSSDPFSNGSLFDKTLRHDLPFEQLVRYKRWETSTLHAP